MKTKTKRVIALIAALLLIGFLLIFLNGTVGNPISKAMAKSAAQDYMDARYDDLQLELKDVIYGFKFSEYLARYQSAASQDTAFAVYVDSFGHVIRDDYESEVLSLLSTYRRLDKELRDLGSELFREKFAELDIDIAHLSGNISDPRPFTEYLTIDMPLDPHNPPFDVQAVLWVRDQDVSYERMAELLLRMREVCTEANIPVAMYDVRIEWGNDDAGNHLWLYEIPADLLLADDLPAALRLQEKIQNGTI